MKVKIFIGISICLFATSVIAQTTKNKTTSTTTKWTEAQASGIIQYGNQLVDLFNRNAGMATNIKSARSRYEENKQKLSSNKDASIYGLSCNYYLDLNNKNIVPVPPAYYPDKSVAEIFKNCQSIFKRIQTTCESISSYYDKKTYASDKFAQGDAWMTQMENQWDSAFNQMRQAVNKASKLSSEAEMVFLQKSPIKQFIIPMKTDLGSYKELLDEMETNPNADLSALKQKLADMKSTYEKNKVTEGKNFGKMDSYYKLDVYPKFYRDLLDAVASAEKYVQHTESLKQGVKNQTEIQDYQRQAANSVLSYYNKAVDGYNTFVKQ